MATFSRSDDLQGAEFVDVDLSGARFVESDLSGVVMRGVEMARADIDAPWLLEDESVFRVNGVDVSPFVEAELNRRFPGRADRRAEGSGRPARGLGRARAHLGGHPRARRGDAGRHGRHLGGRRVVVRADAAAPGPGHGQVAGCGRSWSSSSRSTPSVSGDAEADGRHVGLHDATPSYAEVLEVRAGRVAMVRDFLAAVTPDELATTRRNPHNPDTPGDHPLLPARDPRGGVGAPPLRSARPRRDRGDARRVSRRPDPTRANQRAVRCALGDTSRHQVPEMFPKDASASHRREFFRRR